MSSDIVTRLHEEIDSLKVDVQVVRDAITEIERLQAAGDEMADAATRQQWSRLDVAVAAWNEARRG